MTTDAIPAKREPAYKTGVFLATFVLSALAGCETYRPLPLPAEADIRAAVTDLSVDVSRLQLEPLRSVVIDPRNGITPLGAAVLAVLNNPDLRAKRVSLAVPAAQVFAAGLLPDPQISVAMDQPTAGPDTHTAFSISPNLDLAGLMAVATSEEAARFTAKQAKLDLLWAEWTVAGRARLLAETVLTDEARAALLGETARIAGERAQRSTAALGAGDVDSRSAAMDLAARLDAETALTAATHDAQAARRALNDLLGLKTSVTLPLVHGDPPGAYADDVMERDLASLPTRRPDLLALQAGYGAQDANLRRAIISQFPPIAMAMAYARDPTPTTTVGASAVLALPIFNGHRGEVRVQEASRDELREEYQARLDQAATDVRRAAIERVEATRQAEVLRADLLPMTAMLDPAPRAFANRDIDSQTYLTLVQTVIAKEIEMADRDLAARKAQIDVETALFAPPAVGGKPS